jgi:hypothetical protein
MTQRIILFNGPPRCGKDTAARACLEAEDLNGYFRIFERMSRPLKRSFAGLAGANFDRFDNLEYFEEHKEDPWTPLGVSYRQFQIDMSEKFMKKCYGDSVFGRLFIQRVQRKQHVDAVAFVPDCGFDTEYTTLVNGFGSENVLVVKIYRPGTDFKSDSRNYLKVGSFGDKRDTEHVIHTNNAGTENEFKQKIVSRVGKWLNGGQS